jgi:hypothetical protein
LEYNSTPFLLDAAVLTKQICGDGMHLFCCNEIKNFLLMRHDMLRYDLKQLGIHGGNNVIDSELGQIMVNDERKGDLLFNGMEKDGCGLVVDISIGTATAQSYLDSSATFQTMY